MLIHFSQSVLAVQHQAEASQIVGHSANTWAHYGLRTISRTSACHSILHVLDDMVMDCELISDVHICPITSITPPITHQLCPPWKYLTKQLIQLSTSNEVSTPLWTFCLPSWPSPLLLSMIHHSGCSSGRWMALVMNRWLRTSQPWLKMMTQ